MDDRFPQRNAIDRPRYSERFARRGIGRAHVEGNGQLWNQTGNSKIVLDSISRNGSPLGHLVAFEPRRNSSKKASGTPIKTLIHEEMSREKKASQPSPSVIAKLMGLDSLPLPQTVAKQQKEARSLPSSTYISHNNCSIGLSTSEHQEFKDVFEIKDSIKVEKHKKQPVFKGNSRRKQGDTDVAFIRQKFMEAKRLSTDETLQNSKEFNDALEVLDSNKGLFLKFLEEPNSLFTKHLHDPEGFSLAPCESHITVLKSSKGKMYEIDGVSCKSEVNTETCTKVQKDAISSLKKPNVNLFNHLLKEHSGSLSHKLLKSRHAGKTCASLRSTRIVVLKPNLGKSQDMATNVSQPSSHENYLFGYRRRREFQQSGIQELHAEGRERQNLFDNVEFMGHRIKGSREIAREITKQMNDSVSSGPDKTLVSGPNRYIKDEGSYAQPGMYNPNNTGAYQRRADNFDYWSRASNSSTSCSTESFVSREARKRLSERWRMANRLQEAGFVGRGSSTLGEMLALSGREVRWDSLDSVTAQKVSDDELARGMMGAQFYPSGIGSRDGWKDEGFTNSPISSSLPASSTVPDTPKSSRQRVGDGDRMLKDVLNLGVDDSFHGNLNQRRSSSRKSYKFRDHKPHLNPIGEENKLPVREIHVNQEDLRNGIHVSEPSEAKPILSKLSDGNITSSNSLVGSSSLVESINAEKPFITSEEDVQQPAQKGESSGIRHINEVKEEKSPCCPEVDSIPSQCGEGSELFISSEDAEQTRAVSVLEHPSSEGESSPECFERVSADLQELRMQLQLLRLESDKYNTECETPILSEDGTGECNSPPQKGEIWKTYRNEDDRDYSYLLDMLIDLGIDGALQDSLLNAYFSPKHPSNLEVFEKLEEKYGVFVEWSKSERKKLFDLFSSILVENFSPCMDQKLWLKTKSKPGPIWGHKGLVEEVWQMVVRLRKELNRGKPEVMILDPRWLDLGDDLDSIGREIEQTLTDDILEQLVFEFILD